MIYVNTFFVFMCGSIALLPFPLSIRLVNAFAFSVNALVVLAHIGVIK